MLALGSQGMRMGMLAVIARQLEQEVFMVAAPLTAARWMGFIFGAPALAAALTQALAGLWMERLGMRRIMLAANVFSWVGGVLCLSVDAASQGVAALWLFFAGSIFLGLGGGCYETVNNTLVPTLYADDRERKMSQLHAWWPGGMLVGTLVGAALMVFELGWRFKFALSLTPILLLTALVPATVYPILRLAGIGNAGNAGSPGGKPGSGSASPEGEAEGGGESGRGSGGANSAPSQGPGHDRSQGHGPKPDPRWGELLRPACLWLLFCMVLTATIELLPPPWFSVTLARTTEVTGSVYLILVFTTMFGLRQVLALFAHRIKPMTLLHLSAIFALAGFLLMARATEAWQGVLAVLFWAAGCSAFWPTMMVLMSQRHARAGALGLGLLGTVGTLADFVAQPLFGHVYDRAKIAAAGGQEAFTVLTERAAQAVQAGAEATGAAQGLEAGLAHLAPAQLALEGVLRTAAQQAFAYAAWLPLVLIPALVVLGFFYRVSSFTK
jgi:MFS family permease